MHLYQSCSELYCSCQLSAVKKRDGLEFSMQCSTPAIHLKKIHRLKQLKVLLMVMKHWALDKCVCACMHMYCMYAHFQQYVFSIVPSSSSLVLQFSEIGLFVSLKNYSTFSLFFIFIKIKLKFQGTTKIL